MTNNLKFTIGIFLVLITLATFLPLKNHEFIEFDDSMYVTENFHIQSGFKWKNIIWAFSTFHFGNWHPLTWLSYMLDYYLYGMNPGGYHLTNLIFHMANTLLLFWVLYRMTGAIWKSAFVASFFALHPLHVESVAWVADRRDVLSTFFWILTMWAYVHYSDKPNFQRYLLVFICFGLGLMCKAMLITLPFVMLLLDYWPLDRYHHGKSRHHSDSMPKPEDNHSEKSVILRLILEKIPFLALTVIFTILNFIAQQKLGALKPVDIFPITHRLANALNSYIGYLQKMVWPHHLSIFYPYPQTVDHWKVIVAGFMLAGISIFVARNICKHPYLFLGWLWYLGTLIPVIGLLQIGDHAMADRYTYVPLIGPSIMIAWGVPHFVSKLSYRRFILALLTILSISSLTISTWVQISYWQNSITLFEHALNVTDRNYLAHNNLGIALYKQGKNKEAIAHFSEALKIRPNGVGILNNLGAALARQGRAKEAVLHFQKLLELTPNDEGAHYNLGLAFLNERQWENAIKHFKEVIRIKPQNDEMHYRVGTILEKLDRFKAASLYYKKTIRINPSHDKAHYHLGICLVRLNQLETAIKHFKEAIRITPEYQEAHNNLGVTYAQQKKFAEAIKHYSKALQLKPDSMITHLNFGIALAQQKNFKDAIKHYSEALKIAPDYPEIHFHLGLAFSSIGDTVSALKEYETLKSSDPRLADRLFKMISQ